jgi:hypothetical protein
MSLWVQSSQKGMLIILQAKGSAVDDRDGCLHGDSKMCQTQRTCESHVLLLRQLLVTLL